MPPFFRRKTPPPEHTFNERVDAFWKWYASVADRFFQTIEDKRCGDLATGARTSPRKNYSVACTPGGRNRLARQARPCGFSEVFQKAG